RDLFDADIERHIDVGAGGRLPSATRAGSRSTAGSTKSAAEDFRKDVGGIAAKTAARTRGAELEMRTARTASAGSAAEPRKRIATASTAEIGEARLAGRVDLTAVELAAPGLVADDFVSLVDLGKAVLRF